MALLARHLYFDFPQYYNVFGRKSHVAAGKRVFTTNRLLASYRGAEGMKTGYTRAAGYNLVAVANRGRERVIAVVMGGNSTRTRNAQAAKLLDLGFRRAPSRVAEVAPRKAGVARVARAPLPPARPGVPATGLQAVASALSVDTAHAAAAPSRSRMAPLYAAIPPEKPDVETAWAVELGDFDRETEAIALVVSLALAKPETLSDARVSIRSAEGARARYRVAVAGKRRMDPTEACRLLARIEPSCRPAAPDR
jgi:D-alanyl-D-alanine carboxypeptidase